MEPGDEVGLRGRLGARMGESLEVRGGPSPGLLVVGGEQVRELTLGGNHRGKEG